MKKYLLIAVAACVALAACTKNEIKPVEVDQEITFQTISTKGASPFAPGKKFVSYAYFHTTDWAGSGSTYIDGQTIEYKTNYPTTGKNAWAGSQKYYWPKNGKLTFFAWTNFTGAPSSSVVSCSAADGIKFTDYVSTTANTDLGVAKIAANYTANPADNSTGSNSSVWVAGVPTVFQHILSSVKLTAKTKESYSDAEITLTKVEISTLGTMSTYTQGSDASKAPIEGTWATPTVSTPNLPLFTGSQLLNDTAAAVTITAGTDFSILIPQNLSSTNKITVTYTVKTNYGTELTNTYTFTTDLSTLVSDNKLKSGTEYTLNLIIGLDEILWDPAEEPWNKEPVDINI